MARLIAQLQNWSSTIKRNFGYPGTRTITIGGYFIAARFVGAVSTVTDTVALQNLMQTLAVSTVDFVNWTLCNEKKATNRLNTR